MNATQSRRGFLREMGRLGWITVPASVTFGLNACGGGGSGGGGAGAGGTALPFSDLTVIQNPQNLTLSIQSRQVQWVQGVDPAQANAWVYVAVGHTPTSVVLPNHLGPIFNIRRNQATTLTWANTIGADPHAPLLLDSPPIDAPPVSQNCGNVKLQSPVGFATHVHGARVAGSLDGWPLTPISFAGNPYGFPTQRQVNYPNAQRSTMLWYHDHGMDRTAPQVHAGLAGLYFIRDAADDAVLSLLGGSTQELPLVLQDRIVGSDGKSIHYAVGRPDDGPLARPEFLGTRIFVNGHPGGTLKLDRRPLRLRLLNGSNARTYALALMDPGAVTGRAGQVWQSQCLRLIGADGGLLGRSVALGASDVLLLAPGQRRDVVLDLSGLAAGVTQLRLVNLAIQSLLAFDANRQPEAIFTTAQESVLFPTGAAYTAADQTLYDALALPQASVMAMELQATVPPASSSADQSGDTLARSLEQVLGKAASDDDFQWTGQRFEPWPGTPMGPNRLVLLVSNTQGYDPSETGSGLQGWSDVQIFEMKPGGQDWTLPFDIDLQTASNPPAGAPSSKSTSYGLGRRSFFAQETAPDISVTKTFPPLHAPGISAKAGTCERWYVANIGNAQPLSTRGGSPDMHPFHIHLVNFIVTRRWQLSPDQPGQFVPLPANDQALDAIARQDTVLIPSNQMVELLVHYPPGYSGDYVYHCHILEHEDMCMMSHFHVDDDSAGRA